MSKQLAYIELTLLFEPATTWNSMSDLEADFAEFLKTKRLEAEIVAPVGNASSRVLYVRPLQEFVPPVPEPTKEPGAKLKEMAQPKDFSGKFRKTNG